MNLLSNSLLKTSVSYMKDPARFNRIAYTMAWGASSTGQVVSIAKNKKIPEKEKRFLIPQEIANGILNVSFFWTIALLSEKFGKFITEGKNPIVKVKGFEPGCQRQKILVAGMSAITGIIGGILASDIIAPVIRNKIAANIQKRSIDKEKQRNQAKEPMQPKFQPNASFYQFLNHKTLPK